jgi:hypothetical protein
MMGLGAAGALGWQVTPPSVKARVEGVIGTAPEAYVPAAAEGQIRLERVTSRHMGEVERVHRRPGRSWGWRWPAGRRGPARFECISG